MQIKQQMEEVATELSSLLPYKSGFVTMRRNGDCLFASDHFIKISNPNSVTAGSVDMFHTIIEDSSN